MINNVVINARALSIITAMADVPRDRLMAAHMIIRLDLDKYAYMVSDCPFGIFKLFFICKCYLCYTTKYVFYMIIIPVLNIKTSKFQA